MSHSSSAAKRRKPAKALYAKPSKSFPLYPNAPTKADARWCKKVRGKLHYFGKCSDDPKGQKALEEWSKHKEAILLTGRKADVGNEGGLTLKALADQFMAFKEGLLHSGELVQRSYDEYYATGWILINAFGKDRLVTDLSASDFQRLRTQLAKRYGPIRLGNTIQRVRSLFKFGYESGLIDAPPRFGPGFKKPSAKVLRKSRASKGEQMFSREQLQAILEHATPNARAMTLLAVNGGLGNTDLARLPLGALDLKSGWLVYPREKTGVPRRIPLWPETVAAIREVIEHRNEPSDPADAGLLFIGRRGESYTGSSKGYRVAQEFARVLKSAKVEGRTFYDLRRTFQTIGEGANDLVAVQSVMGHAPASDDMSAIYRQRVDDSRLQAVTDHVRGWLFGRAVQ